MGRTAPIHLLHGMWKRTLTVLAIVVAVFTLFLFWYNDRFSMDRAEPMEVVVDSAVGEVLIATQGSAYKDALTEALMERLKADEMNVRVIDVSDLHLVDPSGWDAVVIMHTWEVWKPEPNAAAFFARYPDRPNVIVLSTSGSGEMRLDPVDGISSASVVSEVPRDAEVILERIRAVGH